MIKLLNTFFDYFENMVYWRDVYDPIQYNQYNVQINKKKIKYQFYDKETETLFKYSFSKNVLVGYAKYKMSIYFEIPLD